MPAAMSAVSAMWGLHVLSIALYSMWARPRSCRLGAVMRRGTSRLFQPQAVCAPAQAPASNLRGAGSQGAGV